MKRLIAALFSVLLLAGVSPAQSKDSVKKLNEARREMASPRPNPEHVEKLLKQSLKDSPDYLDAQRALAELYSMEHRYDAAADEFKKAKALDDQQKKLSRLERDEMLDALGVSLAQARHLDEAVEVYKAALAEHADYALFEYNLACTYAEKGDIDSAIPHLKKSWELRSTIPEGTQFPDPRKDDSFKKYWNDSRFQKAVENIVV